MASLVITQDRSTEYKQPTALGASADKVNSKSHPTQLTVSDVDEFWSEGSGYITVDYDDPQNFRSALKRESHVEKVSGLRSERFSIPDFVLFTLRMEGHKILQIDLVDEKDVSLHRQEASLLFTHCPKLLEFSGILTIDSLSSLEYLKSLTSLDLRIKEPITNAEALLPLGNLMNLCALRIDAVIHTVALKVIGRLNVQILSLKVTTFDRALLANVLQKNLKHLFIKEKARSALTSLRETFSVIADSCPGIEEIFLVKNFHEIRENDSEELLKCKNLCRLALSDDDRITDKTLEILYKVIPSFKFGCKIAFDVSDSRFSELCIKLFLEAKRKIA